MAQTGWRVNIFHVYRMARSWQFVCFLLLGKVDLLQGLCPLLFQMGDNGIVIGQKVGLGLFRDDEALGKYGVLLCRGGFGIPGIYLKRGRPLLREEERQVFDATGLDFLYDVFFGAIGHFLDKFANIGKFRIR